MSIDVVTGCDAIDAGPDWLRVKVKGSAVRPIPWDAIRLAGLASSSTGEDPHQIDIDTAAPTDPAHQSLWIVHPDGVVEVKLEESSPKRTQVLETLAEKLGDRWQGTQFSAEQMMMEMFSEKSSAAKGIPRMVLLMIAVMLFAIVAAIAALVISQKR